MTLNQKERKHFNISTWKTQSSPFLRLRWEGYVTERNEHTAKTQRRVTLNTNWPKQNRKTVGRARTWPHYCQQPDIYFRKMPRNILNIFTVFQCFTYLLHDLTCHVRAQGFHYESITTDDMRWLELSVWSAMIWFLGICVPASAARLKEWTAYLKQQPRLRTLHQYLR